MRFDDDGVLHYTEQEVRDCADDRSTKYSAKQRAAAQDWVNRQCTSPQVGDRFSIHGVEHILSQTGYAPTQLTLVSIKGKGWTNSVIVADARHITKKEWQCIGGDNFTSMDKTNG